MTILAMYPSEPAILPLWTDGAPPHVAEATVAIDQWIAGQMRCRKCRHRGLTGKAQHAADVYRVLCRCPQCGAVEEL